MTPARAYHRGRTVHPREHHARTVRLRLVFAAWYLAVTVAVFWMPLFVWVRK